MKLARLFLPQVGACLDILGLFSHDLPVPSHSDGRLHNSWKTWPSCGLTRLSLLLFSLRLAKFPHFLALRTTIDPVTLAPYLLDSPSLPLLSPIPL